MYHMYGSDEGEENTGPKVALLNGVHSRRMYNMLALQSFLLFLLVT
jgi:hypothetical protein